MSTQIATAPIDAAQVAQYHADGFLVVRQVFSAERIAELDAEAQRLQAPQRPDRHEQHPLPLAEPRRDR